MSLAGSIEETNAMVAKGEHYEALQLYSRLVKGLEQKGDHDSLTEAASVAEGAIRTMMRYSQFSCASQLVAMLFNLWKTTDVKLTVKTLAKVVKFNYSYTPAGSMEHLQFVEAMLGWCHSVTKDRQRRNNAEYERVCQICAGAYESAGKCGIALEYLLTVGNEPIRIAEVTAQLSKKGLKSESDLFIARVVLRLLASDLNLGDKVAHAQTTLALYLKESPIGGVGKIPDWEAQSALLHYLDFVIALMKDHSSKTPEGVEGQKLYLALKSLYGPSLNRDVNLVMYVDAIAHKVFAVPVQTQKPPPLMSMMQNLFGGMKKA